MLLINSNYVYPFRNNNCPFETLENGVDICKVWLAYLPTHGMPPPVDLGMIARLRGLGLAMTLGALTVWPHCLLFALRVLEAVALPGVHDRFSRPSEAMVVMRRPEGLPLDQVTSPVRS